MVQVVWHLEESSNKYGTLIRTPSASYSSKRFVEA